MRNISSRTRTGTDGAIITPRGKANTVGVKIADARSVRVAQELKRDPMPRVSRSISGNGDKLRR